ncbi:DUF2617 family protein [Streptomyces sp. SID3343]|uniref:DUF2617 family protein n=1 Tax=Streptomyces sp. SID3343 TaxID=2690260 RepID=UPI001371C32D|nr:DUF2617 family protein [Streptomyces sp. SID3343]MYW01497.1 DUF2617 family protein [Streptomyces sp. SID3343]
MHATLTTSYTDTRAEDLGWCLGLPSLPALAERTVELGGLKLELRLLGASHQMMIDPASGGLEPVSETVACVPGAATPLPARAATRLGRWEYEFTALTQSFADEDFVARVREIVTLASGHTHGLIGDYPGLPYAVTAMVVERCEAGAVWSTWHTYPQERRIVSTRSRAM